MVSKPNSSYNRVTISMASGKSLEVAKVSRVGRPPPDDDPGSLNMREGLDHLQCRKLLLAQFVLCFLA